MIKIVHIAKPIGGVGVYIHLLSKHLSEKDFSNSIICNTEDDIIQITNSEQKVVDHYHVNLKREISILNDIKCLRQIIKHLKRIKPDIIHCHSAKAGVLGRIAGNRLNIPTLYTPHAYSYLSSQNKLKQLVFKSIEKSFKKGNSKILACSLSEYNRAINDLKYSEEKVLCWNNSVAKIKLNAIPDVFEKLPENFICSIGRPSYQKNTILLIKSIFEVKKQIENIHLVILGVGLYSPFLKKVNELVKYLNLNKNITLIPWMEREEALFIVQKSQFLVSTSRYEGLPYAVIEALALSKACILTDVDGNKDLVKHGYNGFLVNNDEQEIAEKIITLYNDKKILIEQSQNSFKLFLDKFEITKNIKRLENIYKSMV